MTTEQNPVAATAQEAEVLARCPLCIDHTGPCEALPGQDCWRTWVDEQRSAAAGAAS